MKKPNIEEIENWFKRDGHTSESWMADRLIEYINYLECMKGDHMSATTHTTVPTGGGCQTARVPKHTQLYDAIEHIAWTRNSLQEFIGELRGLFDKEPKQGNITPQPPEPPEPERAFLAVLNESPERIHEISDQIRGMIAELREALF